MSTELGTGGSAVQQTEAIARSLHFKRLGRSWSVRVGLHYVALAAEERSVIVWFWIGTHAIYNRLVSGR
jgi:hypothetical protein